MYHCRARAGGDPSSYSLSSNYLSFQVVIPVRGAGLVSDPDPRRLGGGEALSALPGADGVPPVLSLQHAGWYYCIVRNNMTNSRFSSSSDLEVRVKVFLSEPQISFSVTKEESGYRADVRCWSARGSPPVRFRLIKGNLTLANRTTESLSAVFPVPVSIGRSLGLLRCGGCNHDNRELLSRPLNLEVVPVGGAVQLHVEYLYSAGSEAVGVALRCLVSHGTFPEYAWFLNHTLLQGGGASHIITQEGHTLILPIITAGNSGSYRCQAKDSFDNTTWIPSPAAFIQKTGRRLVSSEVIAVAFCCFLLLVLVGSVCWIFTFSKRRLDSRLRRRSSAAIPATGIGDRGTEAILYELYQENKAKAFGDYTADDGHAANFTLQAKPDYDGNFFCKASVQNISAVPFTVSDVHYLRVIVPVNGTKLVSDPPLAEIFEGRGLTLTCTVKTGTHVSYQWSHNENPTRMSHHGSSGNRLYVTEATLEDAGNYSCRATNQLNDTHIYSSSDHIFIREGEVRCEAANGDRPVTSDTLTLEVVPVNGTVKLTSNRVGSFSGVAGLALHCEVKRGTFPRYHWFLNDSGLDVRGDFYSIQGDGQTLLLKSVTASSSGFYHCVATDSFDEMNSINSEKLFIDKNGGLVLGKPILHAPDVSLAGDIETISCFVPDAPKTEAILYELYQENKAKAFGDYTAYDGHAANFTLQAKPDYDGNFYCKASVQNISAVPSTISDVHYLRVIVPVEGAELVSDPPLAEVFEGRGLTLTCTVKTGTHVSYQWSHNENPTRMSHHGSSGNRLYVTEATLEDAGNYSCRATNQLNDQIYSSSDHIFIRVKVSVSKPKISLTVHKEDDGYVASVTCRSDKGTPPVNFTFTLLNETRAWQIIREGDPRSASLAVPVTLNRKEGEVRCEAANGDRPVTSDTLTLEVVKRGTFPRYHWFLNDSGLDVRGDFYSIQGDGQTLLLKSVTASSSGFYHCVATDSFDEMNSINSEKLFIDKNALAGVSAGVFAVVLSCFLFLLCLLTGCCVYGAIYRRRLSSMKPSSTFISPETDSLESEEEEPVESEYMEDMELVKAANIDYTEKGEEESVDEWPEIERALQISCMDEAVTVV
ncbi:hypothetical protein ANANG_G00026730 [Anguilla anguilla]|uniref:Ig-like domain-containing protein n=1 Tax=Anguilla anguilla TaxID=7936 RepID=A0A9D3S6D0_ANGAN|nr:hypothetical protein ANANG_G00026730 [Anguilla anguilla]